MGTHAYITLIYFFLFIFIILLLTNKQVSYRWKRSEDEGPICIWPKAKYITKRTWFDLWNSVFFSIFVFLFFLKIRYLFAIWHKLDTDNILSFTYQQFAYIDELISISGLFPENSARTGWNLCFDLFIVNKARVTTYSYCMLRPFRNLKTKQCCKNKTLYIETRCVGRCYIYMYILC